MLSGRASSTPVGCISPSWEPAAAATVISGQCVLAAGGLNKLINKIVS